MMDFDVAVIGAGPAGSVAARWLALAGHKVLMVDELGEMKKVGESLPGAARPLLDTLDLMPWLESSQPQPYIGNASAWGQDILVSTDFIRDPNGAGWHLDRDRFDACLREAACTAGVQWLDQRFMDTGQMQGGWWLRMKNRRYSARWLIDASGRCAVLARRLGVQRQRDAGLVAIHAWAPGADSDQRTLIEAAAHGWWYGASLPHGRRIAALHVSTRDAAPLLRRHSGWFEQLQATRYMRSICPPDSEWSRLRATDAGGSFLQQWTGNNWLAVGDAALAFDPLSSQGIFNALYTGMRGAQAVHGALDGCVGLLTEYSDRLQQIRQAYMQRRCHHYAAEQRWSTHSFWREQRNQSGAGLG